MSRSKAWKIFTRDITRLCEYFIRQGLPIDADRLAVELWKSYEYRLRPEVPPDRLDAGDPVDRQYWQKGRKAD